MLFNLHIKFLQCLDDLLLLASSGVEALGNRDTVFYSLSPIGFLQLRLSHLSLSQALTYMGMISGARL